MKILVATDAWHPQVNGVVRTLGHVAREARALGAELEFLTPGEFWTLPMPTYPEVRLALTGPGAVERKLERARPDAIHVATEGPLGHAVRRVCMRRGLPFTTSLHTRFPDYLAERLPVPERWTCEVTWAWLRRFHSAGAAVLAATPTLGSELATRGFKNVKLWSRGVDADLFHPRKRGALDLPRPIFLTVGRVAVEKNLEAFLKLDLPGTKVIVGDGPARALAGQAVSRRGVSWQPRGRGAGRDLRRRRRVRVPEPHRHLRPGAAGGAGERRAGCGFSRRGAARRHRRGAGRRAGRGSAARLPGGAGTVPSRLPRFRARHDLGEVRAHLRRACGGSNAVPRRKRTWLRRKLAA